MAAMAMGGIASSMLVGGGTNVILGVVCNFGAQFKCARSDVWCAAGAAGPC